MTVSAPVLVRGGTSGTPGTRVVYPLVRAPLAWYRAGEITRYPTGTDPVPDPDRVGTGKTRVPGTRYLPGTNFTPSDLRSTGSTAGTAVSANGREHTSA